MMNIRKIRQLARMLKSEDLDELEVREGEFSLRLKRSKKRRGIEQDMRSAPESAAGAPAKDTESKHPAKEPEPEGVDVIVSPLAGTFYRAKAPGAPPFVNVGESVKKGQTLCILEAMKLMNELEAEKDCKIVEILIEDAQTVNEGQALFKIIAG